MELGCPLRQGMVSLKRRNFDSLGDCPSKSRDIGRLRGRDTLTLLYVGSFLILQSLHQSFQMRGAADGSGMWHVRMVGDLSARWVTSRPDLPTSKPTVHYSHFLYVRRVFASLPSQCYRLRVGVCARACVRRCGLAQQQWHLKDTLHKSVLSFGTPLHDVYCSGLTLCCMRRSLRIACQVVAAHASIERMGDEPQ